MKEMIVSRRNLPGGIGTHARETVRKRLWQTHQKHRVPNDWSFNQNISCGPRLEALFKDSWGD